METHRKPREILSAIADIASIVTAVTVLLFGAAVIGAAAFRSVPKPASAPAPVRSPVSDITGLGLETSLPTESKGRVVDGTVAIVEFSDLQCPYCGRYAREIFPVLEKRLIETGKVVYGVRDFPLDPIHPLARLAGHAAVCASDKKKFWEMRAKLFEDQRALDETNLVLAAQTIGLERQSFSQCLDRHASSPSPDEVEGRRLGVSQTPTFFVGVAGKDGQVKLARKIIGLQSYATFSRVVNEVLDSPQERR